MPYQPRNLQVSFAGGEMSPEMFSRYDDPRFRSGAARMLNMICHPRGSVARRPGFGLVNEVKDSAFKSRLLPFRFSTEQALAIEAGRATIEGATAVVPFTVGQRYEIVLVGTTDFTLIGAASNTPGEIFTATGPGTGSGTAIESEERGYFRFHADGGTLLQPRPPEFRGRERGALVNLGAEEWQLTQSQPGPSHGFQTADPIVFTVHTDPSSLAVTFDIGADEVTVVAGPHGYGDGDTVVFSSDVGGLPAPLEPERYYYIRDAGTPGVSTTFRLSEVRGGALIDFTTTGGAGPFRHGVLPTAYSLAGEDVAIEPNRTYYAIFVSDLLIRVALTRADALANEFLDWRSAGTVIQGEVAVHYDYRQGATVYDGTRVGATNATEYLFRPTSWGEPGSRYMRLADHLGHLPGDTNYWQETPGSSSEVTFNNLLNRVLWMAHPLSNGDPITFTTTDTLPGELEVGRVYYVREQQTDFFAISETPNGLLKTFTTNGLGTHTAFGNGYYEVPHFYAEDTLFGLTYVQSNDVLTMAHVDKPAAELKRRGPVDWILEDVTFNTSVEAPRNVRAGVVDKGEAQRVTRILGFGTTPISLPGTPGDASAQFYFEEPHLYGAGERVTVENFEDPTPPPVYVPDGLYVVDVNNLAPNNTGLTLKEFDTGEPVRVALGTYEGATLSTLALMRSSPPFIDGEERYVVTALDDRNEESEASEPVSITNNLLVAGSYNTITWDPVENARRYRVYRDVNGLFGLIGETDAPSVEFTDENIGPDLSFTPPILDTGLRVEVLVTFDIPASPTTIFAPDHGFEDGASVVFFTNDTLPLGIVQGTTYYVLNAEVDAFEIAADPQSNSITLGGTPAGEHTATSGNFPGAVTYFEQRRVFGGSRVLPQDFWMTASGTEEDLSYSIPTLDADRIQNRLAAREYSEIRHAVPAGHLLLLTSSAEYRLTSLDGGPLTPGSISARAPTQVGVDRVQPVVVNNAVLFAADRGGHIREMGFAERVSDYVTGDITLRAAHLFDDLTVSQMALHQAPQQIVWTVSSSGSLLGLTYIPEEQVAGWHDQRIDGAIESAVAIPEGDEDFLYIIGNRGGTRYVERMGSQYVDAIEDSQFLDSSITYKGQEVTQLFIRHLAGLAVEYLADGIAYTGTVDITGTLVLAVPATTVHVGLPYESRLETVPLGMQVDAAAGVGRTKNVNQVFVRVYESGPFQSGPTDAALSTSPGPAAGQLQTELEQVTLAGRWNLEGQVIVRSVAPLPLIITGLTLETATGG